jgi:fibronectin type 3 domain-containing protein
MKLFTRVAFLLLAFVAVIGGQEAKAQLTMTPLDSVYTYNSKATLGTVTNPNQPATGKIGKWIRTVRMSWNTNEYKAYIFNGTDFRIHFPHTYNPTTPNGKRYPIIAFYHGDGEDGTIYDNEDQLDHGAQPFESEIDAGGFDGFALFIQTQYGFGVANDLNIQALIDSLCTYYQGDPYRVIQNGLSGGGQGEWNNLVAAPTYFGASIPMSAALTADATPADVQMLRWTPIWNLDGGLDNDPPPYTAQLVASYFLGAGSNYVYHNFTTLGHDTWDSTWLLPNFWPFCNSIYQSNPWPLFGRTNFCPGQTIKVTIGVVPGMAGYVWRKNGVVIPGATADTLLVTAAGTYDCQIKRGNYYWSDFSHTPVTITVQGSTQTPPITTVNGESAVLPDAAGDTTVTLQLPTGDSIYTWKYLPTGQTVGTSPTLTVGASKTGDYTGSIIPYQGCSSIPSPAFPVAKASGPNPPPPATTLVATPQGFTAVRLTWSAAPNPTYPPTAYEIYRGTKSGVYKLLAQAAYDSLGYTDATASAGTTYFYVVRAVDTTGAAALSNMANTMTSADVTPPTAPGNLQVVATTNATATLSWTASTDNVGVDHYAVYVNGQLAMVTQTLSIIVNGLNKGQVYTFVVKAVDASGNYSNPSNQVSAPIIYNGLSYSYYTTQTSWTDLPNFSTLTPVMIGQMPNVSIANATQTTNFGYQWIGYITIPVAGTYTFETTSDDGSALWFNTLVPGSTSTATVNNDGQHGSTTVKSKALTLTAGVYPIVIEYFQATGGSAMTVSWSCKQLFGNTNFVAIANQYFAASYTPAGTAPAKPTAIVASASSYNKVNVSWTSNSTTQTGFEVYRATSVSGPWAIVGTAGANATSFADGNQIQAATKYYYKVQAINQYGGSGYDTASVGALMYNFYQGLFDPLINYDSAGTPIVFSGTLNNFSLAPAGAVTTDFGFLYAGLIHIPVSGTWTFYTSSDDASELFVNGYKWSNVVVNNNFQQGMTQRSGTITLSAGTYPFYVSYEQSTGGDGLTVSWANSAAHIAQSTIPDSAFYYPGWTTTTAALPPAAVTPTILKDSMVTNSTSRFYFSWQDTTSTLTGYTLYRSANDSLHFNILAQPIAGVTQYTDTALFGHTTYYYRLVANGIGGSSAPVTFSATTPDNPPVFAAIASPQFLNYTKTGTVNVNVTDVDGDVIALTASNLPSFATFTPGTGNGTGTLTFTPASQTSNEGSFPGITLTANDGHGAIVTDTFTLIVNNNVAPVFNTVKSDTLNAGSSLAVPITVTDGNPSNVLTFSFTGLPANSVLSPGANGTDTLKLNPNYGDAGNYAVVATVNDGNGGITSDTFHVVINKVSPSQNIYVQFSAGDVAGTPWNVMSASGTATNFVASNGKATTVGLNFQPGWWITYNNGPVTGNNSGVYPDKVEEDYFFFGSYPGVFTGPSTDSVQVTGLNPAQTYSLTFYSGSVWVVLPNNGTTTYTCQGQSGSLAVQNNTQNTVTFSGLQPNANGVITFTLGLGANTQVGYLNALVISSTFNDGTAPLSPSNLAAGLAANGAVQLNWYDSAYNETGYYILRSQSPTGPFVQLPRTVGAGVTSYVDSTSGSNRTYYYEVQAFNSNGVSNMSNIASVSTADRVPTINPIANVNMNYSQTETVTITTTADTTNMVSLTATGLPPFATFTDNGNGTATLTITPSQGASGVFPTVTVTSTDQMDSVRTASFSIIVRDPSVTSTYIHLSDGTQLGGTPWNNFTFWPSAGNGMGSLVNDAGVTTSMAFTFKNGMAGSYVGGMQPHNGAGIFPDPVMRSGDYESGSQIDSITLSGLQQGQAYNIVFFNSVDYGGSGITNYYVNGKTVTLNPNYNINNTVRINDVLPNASGVIYLGVQKVSGQTYAYLNDFIIENYDSAYHLLAPTGLLVKAMNTKSVTLQWQVRSSGETGEQVWRGSDSTGSSYQLIATLAPGTSSFVDSTVLSNRNYYYMVASVNGTTESNLSNVVYANPYAYLIYLSYSVPNVAPAPWNNIGIQPTLGQVWYNFFDANGNVTNTGQVQTGTWGGEYGGGMQTGNNSGVVPDAVMLSSYGLFPGTTGAVQLTGLDLNMTYDLTFFGSANLGGDNNATYTANGGQAVLNATLNETGEVTIFHVSPDVHGNINITCTPSDPQSQFGLMNAVILQAHSLAPSGNTPTVPAGATTITTALNGTALALVNTDSSQTTKPLNAYPNPFHDQFTLQVPAETMNENVVVTIFDVSGKALYQKEFDNLTQGNNYLLIAPMAAQHDGVYFVRVLYSDKKTVKIIKMLRQ